MEIYQIQHYELVLKNIQETELSAQIMKLQTIAWLGTLSELADQI